METHKQGQHDCMDFSKGLVVKITWSIWITPNVQLATGKKCCSVRPLKYPKIILVGGWPTPLKNMMSSVGMIIPNIWKNKKCSKPPISHLFIRPRHYPYERFRSGRLNNSPGGGYDWWNREAMMTPASYGFFPTWTVMGQVLGYWKIWVTIVFLGMYPQFM